MRHIGSPCKLIAWKPSKSTLWKHLNIKRRERGFKTIKRPILAHIANISHFKIKYAFLSHYKRANLIFQSRVSGHPSLFQFFPWTFPLLTSQQTAFHASELYQQWIKNGLGNCVRFWQSEGIVVILRGTMLIWPIKGLRVPPLWNTGSAPPRSF